MAVKSTPVVFITANVGSIFEEPAVMLKIWTREFLSTVARLDPKFIALHCQEVGGKNYEKSMQHVEHFVQLLVESDELRLFDKVRVFLDEDYSSAENFTALGNFYFVHESITDALIYDFETKAFADVSGKEIYSKSIELVPTKQKSKFPLQYFPECKWSRKGFLRTRWSLNGVIFDLVNIHLFHDASNFVAMKSFPSIYSDTRRRALAYTLERFQTDEHGSVPLFLFGDFNFRADTQGVVKHLSEGLNCSATESEVSILEFKKEDEVILSLGKKEFSHSDHQNLFSAKEGSWLREFDKELDAFAEQLFEFNISFPPSYPFEENSSGDKCYMKTRCPAWCDRVILSRSALALVRDTNNPRSVEYGLMGRETCMGDHKPVYLKIHVKGSTERETCPEANHPARELPKPNIEETVSKTLAVDRGWNDSPSDKNVSDKMPRSPGSKYSEVDSDKLPCSLEAFMSQTVGITQEPEENIEPDLSRCSTCKTHQHASRVVDNPGGEQISNETLQIEDEKILGLLAYEIKVPESALQKSGAIDAVKKWEPVTQTQKPESEKDEKELDRYSAVKRVNSASLVENKPKKEDWKNSRCNSDVSWNPCNMVNSQSPEVARIWGINKSFNRGNSRIRLISSSNSLNVSLPRLTSHHSSSDEEWFEEIEESEGDDALEVSCHEIADNRNLLRVNESGDQPLPSADPPSESSLSNVTICDSSPEIPNGEVEEKEGSESRMNPVTTVESKVSGESRATEKRNSTKTLSILRRLTEGRKQSRNSILSNGRKTVEEAKSSASFEKLIVDTSATRSEETELKSEELNDFKNSDTNRMKLSEKLIASVNSVQFAREGVKSKRFDTRDLMTKESAESWETIELTEKKLKEGEALTSDFSAELRKKSQRKNCKGENPNCCCTVQ